MSERIKELEKELAEERAKENKNGSFLLLVTDDKGDFTTQKVYEKTLNKFDKAEMIDALYEIAESFEHLQADGLNSERIGYWAKFMFLLDEPVSKFFSTAFGEDLNASIILNVEVFNEIISKNDWLGEKAAEITHKMSAAVEQNDNK